MVDNKSKTKTEMLLELESIKGLLHEEDDIPILQEMIANKPHPIRATNTATVAQQDFFNKTTTADSATQLLNTLNDFAALAEAVSTHKTNPRYSPAEHSATEFSAAGFNSAGKNKRQEPAKASGENPFLPEHIRTRLHGNNPPPLFELETAKKITHASRPTTLLGNTQHSNTQHSYTTKTTHHQQELIDEIMDIMLPEMAKELRGRLTMMSKEMLEILIAEK